MYISLLIMSLIAHYHTDEVPQAAKCGEECPEKWTKIAGLCLLKLNRKLNFAANLEHCAKINASLPSGEPLDGELNDKDKEVYYRYLHSGDGDYWTAATRSGGAGSSEFYLPRGVPQQTPMIKPDAPIFDTDESLCEYTCATDSHYSCPDYCTSTHSALCQINLCANKTDQMERIKIEETEITKDHDYGGGGGGDHARSADSKGNTDYNYSYNTDHTDDYNDDDNYQY